MVTHDLITPNNLKNLRHRSAMVCSAVVFATCVLAEAQEAFRPPKPLERLTIEELMDIDVTSTSKHPEKLSAAAAAIAVLTPEDIHRSGATSIPELLRLVPGMDVARVDSHTWAISSRGFNDIFANKLLVMIDGRTVYTPLFSGVYWDVQDTFLEDIDRIEVVRGPGAALWGANAVNGVINIITKSARDTQGLFASVGGGAEERSFVNVRYGAKLSNNAFLRVYSKYFSRDSSAFPDGTQAHDAWEMYRGGFRLDWEPSIEDSLTLQGDIYTGTQKQTYTTPMRVFPFVQTIDSTDKVAGANVLGRWSHIFSPDSELTLQSYYDRTVRETAILDENRDTAEIDLQQRFLLGHYQQIVAGLGYRITRDEIRNTLNVTLTPASRTLSLFSAFIQDEISVVPDRFRLTLGSKFEHNDFTGFEIQPSARLLWTPGQRQSVWASVSRAVRTPSRVESDVRLNFPPPVPLRPGAITVFGNPALASEELIAYELGYRVQPADQLTLDLALFYNDYDRLRTVEPSRSGPFSPSDLANNLFGETYGAEIAITAQVVEGWRLEGGYGFLQAHLHRKNGSNDASTETTAEGSSPHHRFFIRSQIDLGKQVRFDSTLRYVDGLSALNVPSYFTVDLRIAWAPTKNLEFAIVGQNLLDDRHPEFAPTFIVTQQTEVERSIYAHVVWQF
jgi:iron complex outermembrane recepter protein